MLSRQAEIKMIITQLRTQISIPNQIAYEAALNAEDERILAVFDMPYADELFSQHALTLEHLRNARSLEELNNVIDNYLTILNFYHQHHAQFYRVISLPFFQEIVARKGDLYCWNELILHPFNKLNSSQSTTLIIDTLTRLSPLFHHKSRHKETELVTTDDLSPSTLRQSQV